MTCCMSCAKETFALPKDNPLQEAFNYSTDAFELQNNFYEVVTMQLSFEFRGVNIGAFAIVPTIWKINVCYCHHVATR
jgi:hypothetical protein